MSTAILLSGGIDSIAVCYWKQPRVAITVNYGQVAAASEIKAAAQVCTMMGVQHEVVEADCSQVGLGNMRVQTDKAVDSAHTLDVPSPEWWPFRNQLLITLAASRCIALNCDLLLIGTVASDSQHRDGTPEFLARMSELLSCQEGSVSLFAPALNWSAMQLIEESHVPISVLAWAHSCHRANVPCGTCRGCLKYRDIFDYLQQLRDVP